MKPRLEGANTRHKREDSLLNILNWTFDVVGGIIAAQAVPDQHIDTELADFSRIMQQFRLDHRIPPEVSFEPAVLPPGVPPPGLPRDRDELLARVGRSESPDEFDRYNDSLDDESSVWLEESTVTATEDEGDAAYENHVPIVLNTRDEKLDGMMRSTVLPPHSDAFSQAPSKIGRTSP